jgi:hypothetical protein
MLTSGQDTLHSAYQDYVALVSQLHTKVLKMRSMEHFVESSAFKDFYLACDVTQRRALDQKAIDNDLVALAGTKEISIRILRKLASQYKIPYYSAKTREQLILEISNIRKESYH